MKSSLFGRQLCTGMLALLLVATPACTGRESDGDILTEISNQMHADPSMQRIKAAVNGGVVTLTGSCDDEPCRQHATNVIKNIQGVKQVVNNVTIAPAR